MAAYGGDGVARRLVQAGIDFTKIGAPQRESILAAGIALQQAGVIPANVDVKGKLDELIYDKVPLTN